MPGSDAKVPEPPPVEIDIRTMESDLKAFKEGGGEVPTAGTQASYVPQQQVAQQPAGYTGPEKPLFETPPAMPQAAAQIQQPVPATSTGIGKTIVIAVAILVGVIGIGLLGYYVIFPFIFKHI